MPTHEWRGVAVAFAIMTTWSGSLGYLLSVPLDGSWWWGPVAVGWMTWLYTGLFITAHDAMHGSLAPRRTTLNHAIGAIAVGLFAMFDYRTLREAHGHHHATPAAEGDPDWHDGTRTHPVVWFWTFMIRYLSVGQWIRMVLWFWAMELVFDLPNLLLFWALPSVLSTIQLFFFGTYLPHREPVGGHTHAHRARSTRLPDWLSLVTCFHFGGYHEEHHDHPAVPWWNLPSVRRAA